MIKLLDESLHNQRYGESAKMKYSSITNDDILSLTSKLSANDIPFIENTTVNTQRLKSFLKDGIGATTGVQQFAIEDIPACVHFQEVTTVEINMKD